MVIASPVKKKQEQSDNFKQMKIKLIIKNTYL